MVVDIPVCGILMGKTVYFGNLEKEVSTGNAYVVNGKKSLKVESAKAQAMRAFEQDVAQARSLNHTHSVSLSGPTQ